MNIIELEQGLRNLIASQPMVLSGNMGEVVRGVLGVTEAYRNFMFRVQSYPVQDVFKFSLISETQKIENDIAGLACAMLQERGINMMLYVPQPNNGFSAPNFGMNFDSPVGQMSYGSFYGNIPGGFGINSTYTDGMREQYGSYANSKDFSNPEVGFAGHEPTGKPSFAGTSKEKSSHHQMAAERLSKPEIVMNEKPVKKSKDAEAKQEKAKSDSPSPAEMLLGDSSGADENAVGRNYLLELLKK